MSNYTITKVKSELIGEEYFKCVHKSGLKVYFLHNTYSTAHAEIAVKYGSAYKSFTSEGKVCCPPSGVAHFLEHKLFETPSGEDTFSLFSKTGADSNAYTTYNMTSYLFDCAENFYASLRILLNMVFSPHFTPESVQREKGIIIQEAKMGRDDPDSRCYYNLLSALYKNNPVNKPVVGAVDDITKITPEDLYLCHSSFYTPDNMILSIAGELDLDEILRITDECLPQNAKSSAVPILPEKETHVYRKLVRERMQVSTPLFAFGIKSDNFYGDPVTRLKNSISLCLLTDICFGASGTLCNGLYDDGLINGELCQDSYSADSYSFIVITAESEKPFTVKKRMINRINEIKANGVSTHEFEASKKRMYSSFIMNFTGSDSSSDGMLSFAFDGVEMLDYPEILKAVTPEYALKVFKNTYKNGSYSFSVIDNELNKVEENENV